MERILETLPAAKKWSLILFILSAVIFVFNILNIIFTHDLRGVIGLVIEGFLVYFLFAYYRACGASIDDESEEFLETACRQQKNIFIIYGIQAAIVLIGLLIAAVSLIIMAIAS